MVGGSTMGEGLPRGVTIGGEVGTPRSHTHIHTHTHTHTERERERERVYG